MISLTTTEEVHCHLRELLNACHMVIPTGEYDIAIALLIEADRVTQRLPLLENKIIPFIRTRNKF